jgi:hypothetical protein
MSSERLFLCPQPDTYGVCLAYAASHVFFCSLPTVNEQVFKLVRERTRSMATPGHFRRVVVCPLLYCRGLRSHTVTAQSPRLLARAHTLFALSCGHLLCRARHDQRHRAAAEGVQVPGWLRSPGRYHDSELDGGREPAVLRFLPPAQLLER